MKKELIINENIDAAEVRVISEDADPVVMKTEDALKRAEDDGLDLIMINPTAEPPVCKIMEMNKYLYDKANKEKSQKKNQKKTETKEIRMSPNINLHDLETKINSANKFLSKGDKVQFTIVYKGREVARMDSGDTLLQNIVEKMQGARVEKDNIRGRNTLAMIMTAAG